MQQRNEFIRLRRQKMPRGDTLAKQAQDSLRKLYETNGLDLSNPQHVKSHCDQIIDELLMKEFELYEQKEQEVNVDLLWQIVKNSLPSSKHLTKSQLEQLIKGKFNEFQDFYKSILQSRRSRAGGSLQNHIAYLFRILAYPFEAQPVINGTPDFILPNALLYSQNPGECILVTVKRTLRERWRQIITEGFRVRSISLLLLMKSKLNII
jgi:superoxide dismutase